MKKYGFTITEMIVALGIIGVVASLTLPNFISQGINDAYAKKLATTVSTLETAFTSMMATEGVQTMSETEFIDNPHTYTESTNEITGDKETTTNEYENSKNIFAKYIKMHTASNEYEDFYGNITHKTISGSNIPFSADVFFQLKNGAIVSMTINNANINDDKVTNNNLTFNKIVAAPVIIDINGSDAPNIWGRDAFWFLLGDDGILYPYGGKIYKIVYDDIDTYDINDKFGCNDKVKSVGCTARLVENNYEVDY